jgi:hypothetical protein
MSYSWPARAREWRMELQAEKNMLRREIQRIERRLAEVEEIQRVIFGEGVNG